MTRQEKLTRLKKVAEESLILRQAVIEQTGTQLVELADLMAGVIGSGRKIMLAGNGAQALLASQFALDLVVRLGSSKARQALPVISLSADSSVLTAAAEDFGADEVFARQIEALGKQGDLLIVLASSGTSRNLLRAIQTAQEKGVLTFGFVGGAVGGTGGTGRTSGRLLTALDRAVVIPHTVRQRVQEEQLFLLHLVAELVESDLVA